MYKFEIVYYYNEGIGIIVGTDVYSNQEEI